MQFILNIGKGILIGAGCILPGISSGVLCVIFGIYEKLLDSVLNFFKDVRKNIKFILPIALGGIIGIIVFSKILQFVLYKYPLQIKSIFIGLILGGSILLFKNINKEKKIEIKNILYIVVSLIIGVSMVVIENKVGNISAENINYINLIISGFFMSIGIVVPGVSSTIILMLLGTYSLYLSSVSTLYLPVLIPMIIGVFLGSLIFMKIIKYLLDKFYIQTMYCIIGFTLGSIFVLFPEMQSLIDIALVFVCALFGYYSVNLLNN